MGYVSTLVGVIRSAGHHWCLVAQETWQHSVLSSAKVKQQFIKHSSFFMASISKSSKTQYIEYIYNYIKFFYNTDHNIGEVRINPSEGFTDAYMTYVNMECIKPH